jgi:hypothetical protein
MKLSRVHVRKAQRKHKLDAKRKSQGAITVPVKK